MINFDTLPQSNPFSTPEPDLYLATIVEANMKMGRDTSKPPYLNLKYNLKKADGSSGGTLYDIISESESEVVKYKIARFVRACNIPLQGNMELKDLAKVVMGITIAVDVTIDDKGDRPRAQVDLFSREAYYTAEEFADVYASIHPDIAVPEFKDIDEGTDEEVPFEQEREPNEAEY